MEKLKDKIEKYINKTGVIRTPAYFIKELFNNVVDYLINLTDKLRKVNLSVSDINRKIDADVIKLCFTGTINGDINIIDYDIHHVLMNGNIITPVNNIVSLFTERHGYVNIEFHFKNIANKKFLSFIFNNFTIIYTKSVYDLSGIYISGNNLVFDSKVQVKLDDCLFIDCNNLTIHEFTDGVNIITNANIIFSGYNHDSGLNINTLNTNILIPLYYGRKKYTNLCAENCTLIVEDEINKSSISSYNSYEKCFKNTRFDYIVNYDKPIINLNNSSNTAFVSMFEGCICKNISLNILQDIRYNENQYKDCFKDVIADNVYCEWIVPERIEFSNVFSNANIKNIYLKSLFSFYNMVRYTNGIIHIPFANKTEESSNIVKYQVNGVLNMSGTIISYDDMLFIINNNIKVSYYYKFIGLIYMNKDFNVILPICSKNKNSNEYEKITEDLCIGGFNKLIQNITTTTVEEEALLDFNGKNNSIEITNQLSDYQYDNITGSPLLNFINNYNFEYFKIQSNYGGSGKFVPHLMALGELYTSIKDTKKTSGYVNPIPNGIYISSTQYDKDNMWGIEYTGSTSTINIVIVSKKENVIVYPATSY